MRRYFVYFMIYSFLGFVLERIINLIALQEWWDNSVLVGPYQPLYGFGVLLALLFYDFYLKNIPSKLTRYLSLGVIAIITTAFSEFIHGEGYEYFQGSALWDYGQTFDMCQYPYVCTIPTVMFGIISALTIIFIHPFIEKLVTNIPKRFFKWIFYGLLFIYLVDVVYTFIFVLLQTN